MPDEEPMIEGIEEVFGNDVTEAWRKAVVMAADDFSAQNAVTGMLTVAIEALIEGLSVRVLPTSFRSSQTASAPARTSPSLSIQV